MREEGDCLIINQISALVSNFDFLNRKGMTSGKVTFSRQLYRKNTSYFEVDNWWQIPRGKGI